MSAVPKAVPTAVAPSTGTNLVPVLKEAQLGPYKPMTGSSINPVVPRSDAGEEPPRQPYFTIAGTRSSQSNANDYGAPTVPVNGFLFKQGPIDSHYLGESQAKDPYHKVNNPPTRGMFTRMQLFQNHIALAPQDVDPNGFRTMPPQQRTSVMLNTLPPHANGYSPETYQPRQLPQRALTYRYNPATGTDPYGSGVLNSDTFGAGQTAGGIGGNQYTPQPGPPDTNSTAAMPGPQSTMPTWG